MSHKITITISDELKTLIDEYNRENPNDKLNLTDIVTKAIYKKIAEQIVLLKTVSGYPIIPCPVCGKLFIQTKPTKKYCSKTCDTEASKQ